MALRLRNPHRPADSDVQITLRPDTARPLGPKQKCDPRPHGARCLAHCIAELFRSHASSIARSAPGDRLPPRVDLSPRNLEASAAELHRATRQRTHTPPVRCTRALRRGKRRSTPPVVKLNSVSGAWHPAAVLVVVALMIRPALVKEHVSALRRTRRRIVHVDPGTSALRGFAGLHHGEVDLGLRDQVDVVGPDIQRDVLDDFNQLRVVITG